LRLIAGFPGAGAIFPLIGDEFNGQIDRPGGKLG
jgi:hypothetical protein